MNEFFGNRRHKRTSEAEYGRQMNEFARDGSDLVTVADVKKSEWNQLMECVFASGVANLTHDVVGSSNVRERNTQRTFEEEIRK